MESSCPDCCPHFEGVDGAMTRSCRTCRWFRPESDGQSGTCANPDLKEELGLHVAVRARELHCRQGWNNDRWQAATDDIVLEIRVKSPASDRPFASDDDLTARFAERAQTVESIVQAWDETERAETNRDSPRP